jgi:hypothetical protein
LSGFGFNEETLDIDDYRKKNEYFGEDNQSESNEIEYEN